MGERLGEGHLEQVRKEGVWALGSWEGRRRRVGTVEGSFGGIAVELCGVVTGKQLWECRRDQGLRDIVLASGAEALVPATHYGASEGTL